MQSKMKTLFNELYVSFEVEAQDRNVHIEETHFKNSVLNCIDRVNCQYVKTFLFLLQERRSTIERYCEILFWLRVLASFNFPHAAG